MNKPKNLHTLSKSIINFKDDYSIGFKDDVDFQLPENAKRVKLHFDENGRLYCMSVLYEGRGFLTETEYSFTEFGKPKLLHKE